MKNTAPPISLLACAAVAMLAVAMLVAQLSLAQEAVPANADTAAAPMPGAAPPAPELKSAADIDYMFVQKAFGTALPKDSKDMTPREKSEFFEEVQMNARAWALAFLAEHPDDPRRWSIVVSLDPTWPRFALKWADNEADTVTDKVAQAAWKKKIEGLLVQMTKAADMPEEVKQLVGMQAKGDAWIAKWTSGKEMAPDFTTYDLAGKPVKISDYLGKVIVLDFWATWCGPCVEAMPHMQALAKKYAKQGVVFLGSGGLDSRADFEKFVKKNQDKYPDIIWSHDSASGDESASSRLYGVRGLPTQMIIDRKGRVINVLA